MAELAGLPVIFGEDQEFTVPFAITKFDPETRIVEGVATSETEDKQGDVVDYKGSKTAFSDWVGNIREMHKNEAVGTRISQDFDDANRSITVRAYISRGAPNTWEKIVDGTLKGYSIGGKALETHKEVIKSQDGEDHERRRVTKYNLSELSIVDSFANPDSPFTLVKSENGLLVQTEIVEEEPPAISPIAEAVIEKVAEKVYTDVVQGEENADLAKVKSVTPKPAATKQIVAVSSDKATDKFRVTYTCPTCHYTEGMTEIAVGKQSPEKKCPECTKEGRDVLMAVQEQAPDTTKQTTSGAETGTGSSQLLAEMTRKAIIPIRLELQAQGEIDGRLVKVYHWPLSKQRGGETGEGRWITTSGGRRVRVTPPTGRPRGRGGREEIPPEPPAERREELGRERIDDFAQMLESELLGIAGVADAQGLGVGQRTEQRGIRVRLDDGTQFLISMMEEEQGGQWEEPAETGER